MKQRHIGKGPHAKACGSFSFPGKIVSGEGAASLAASEAKGRALLLCDPYILRQFGPKIRKNTEMEHIPFPGECSPGNFFRIKTAILEKPVQTLIAAGGGKTLDLAKYLKREIPGLFLINIPTSAATCAAATPVSVLYDENGVYMDTLDVVCPDVVIMDYEIFYDLPMPFFAAGAIDALAKYYEMAAYCENTKKPDPYDLFMLQTIKHSYMRLKKLIREKWGRPDNALKKELSDLIITASAQLSCLGRFTVMAGLAHALAHAVTAAAGARKYLHGEHVSAGLIIQEQYLKNGERLKEIEELAAIMDLPASFSGLGVTKNDLPETEKLYDSIVSREKIFIPEREVMVYNIIKAQF
jgi:glycerol dehydrogenase-like iron-containing ADH family enzyme